MPPFVLDIAVIAALLLVNAVLALAEIAIVTARVARLETSAASGSSAARVALRLRAESTRFLSTIQIGITLVGILAGAFGGARLAGPLGDELDKIAFIDPYGAPVSVAIVVVSITYFSLVIGELVPKRIALQHPERMAIVLARPMRLLAVAVSPLVSVLAVSTDTLLGLLGIRAPTDEAVTEDEIRILVEQSSAAGILEEGERDVIRRALSLADRTAGELMTPRTRADWLDLEDTPEELEARVHTTTRGYLPVARGDLDQLAGVAAVRDILIRHDPGGVVAAVEASVRPAHFVPESASALVLLEQFKRTGSPISLVVDEYGSIQGLVTVTDVLEAIVGDIGPDEASEPGIVERADGSLLVDGMFSIDEFKERIGFTEELPDEPQYQTVAGFVLARLGHIPAAGEQFGYDGYRFEVMDMDGARVDKVLVTTDGEDDAGA